MHIGGVQGYIYSTHTHTPARTRVHARTHTHIYCTPSTNDTNATIFEFIFHVLKEYNAMSLQNYSTITGFTIYTNQLKQLP